tara:strand:+ start:2723 stop:3154 length:432 start_codon:yes stop_codon:yes gene_type:complete
MRIRTAIISDLAKIAKIEKQVFTDSPWNYNLIRDELVSKKDRETLVITDYENIIGYLMIRKSKNMIEILKFAIDKVFQEKGVGWRLFSYFLDSLPVMTEVILEVDQENKKAINLYRKAGFFKIGLRKKYYNDGSDALVMKFIN